MKKHGLIMILCCVLPLLVIALFPRILGSGGIIAYLPLLFCAGIHLFMMKGLHGKGCHGGHEQHKSDDLASPKATTDDTLHQCQADQKTALRVDIPFKYTNYDNGT